MTCAPSYTFNVTAFRAQFPAFTNTTTYPDGTLQAYWDTSGNFVANESGWGLTDAQHVLALNLMTAHLAQLATLLANGQTPTITSAAGIDKINVTLVPPPTPDQWSYWLNTTVYGMQMLALFDVQSVGGIYVGGRPEIAAFRRAGGCW